MRAMIAFPLIIAGVILFVYYGAWIIYEKLGYWYVITPSMYANLVGIVIGAILLNAGAGVALILRRINANGYVADPLPLASSTPAPRVSSDLAGIEDRVSKKLEPLVAAGFEKLRSELADQIIAAGLAPPKKESSVPKPPEV